MYIETIHIREFGGLRDVRLDLSHGLNLVTGDNESGKSTLVSFIRFMLYGLPKRRAGESLSDGDRAFSWENGVADGSMTVTKDGRRYRIERREQSASARRLLTVYDEESGDALPKGDAPGVLLLGIPEEVFDSTACLRQLRSRDLDSDGLSSAIENLLVAGDETLNTERALKNLEKARTALLHKNGHGGEIHRCDTEITSLRLSLDRARDAHRALTDAKEERDRLTEKMREISANLKRAEEEYASLTETAVLSRFDALHEEERRLTEQNEAIRIFHEAHPTKETDPTALCRSIDRAAETLENDERSLLRCEAERRIAGESPEIDPDILRIADAVRASGGADAAVRRQGAYALRRRQASKTALVLFSVGGACLLLGAALALALAKPTVLLVCLLGCVGFLGIPFTAREKRIKKEEEAFLSSLGVTSQDSLTSALDRILNEATRHKEREARIKAADEAIRDAKERETLHKAEAKALLKDLAKDLPEESLTPRFLRTLSGNLTRDYAEKERLESVAALLTERVTNLREELLPYSEPILRERLPEGFSYKDPSALHAYEDKRDRLKEEERRVRDTLYEKDQRITHLSVTSGDSDALHEELRVRSEEKERLEKRHRAILLAIDSIEAARDSLKGRIGPRLRADAEGYLRTLSDGKYEALRLGDDFAISTEENGRTHPSDAYSGGTRDAMYLSLRLALTDLLRGSGDPFPVLLDEALAQLDDTRAEALLKLLLARAENGGQVLLFTCHTREKEMLTGTNTNFIDL